MLLEFFALFLPSFNFPSFSCVADDEDLPLHFNRSKERWSNTDSCSLFLSLSSWYSLFPGICFRLPSSYSWTLMSILGILSPLLFIISCLGLLLPWKKWNLWPCCWYFYRRMTSFFSPLNSSPEQFASRFILWTLFTMLFMLSSLFFPSTLFFPIPLRLSFFFSFPVCVVSSTSSISILWTNVVPSKTLFASFTSSWSCRWLLYVSFWYIFRLMSFLSLLLLLVSHTVSSRLKRVKGPTDSFKERTGDSKSSFAGTSC